MINIVVRYVVLLSFFFPPFFACVLLRAPLRVRLA